MSESKHDLSTLRKAIAGDAAPLRCVAEFQLPGGQADTVFLRTYAGGKHAREEAERGLLHARVASVNPSECGRKGDSRGRRN